MSSSLRRNRFPARLLLLALTVIALPQPATAQVSCLFGADKTPAEPPPANLWNGLKPAYTLLTTNCGSVFGSPSCESQDNTWFDTGTSPWFGTPYWESIDVKNGYAFLATNLGFQIWDVNGNFAEDPDRLIYADIRVFAPINTSVGHDWFQVRDVDASADGNLAAVTGGHSTGMLIIDTTNKAMPKVLYQDPSNAGPGIPHGFNGGREVHVQTIGGRVYGFVTGESNTSVHVNGLWSYDLTRAKELSLPGGCVDYQPTNPNAACTGVFKQRISTRKTGHVDGAGDDVNGHFVVASGSEFNINQNWGFEIWDVSNPASAELALTGHSGLRVDGVALWKEGTKFFLAVSNRGANGAGPHKGQIYDVTCIKTGTCGSLSSMLIYDFPLAEFGIDPQIVGTVQDSVDGSGNPWVYFGRRISPAALGLQTEWLFDVAGISASNPPTEITGGDPRNGNQGQPTMTVGSPPITVGYWSYMYGCYPSGSNFYRPIGAEVYGNRVYRAGYSLFDVHRFQNVSPTIQTSGPSTGYTGQSIQFSATAANCSPIAGGWSWTPSGGGQVVGGGTSANATIQWGTTGAKTVTATNSGCPGATSVAAAIQILDPAPAITSVSVSPTSGSVCTPFTFTANNVTGLPPLTTDWTIEQGGNPVPGEGGSGNPFVWNTEGVAPGSYRGRATVSGPGGSATALSPLVTLTALAPLPSTGFAIAHQAPVLGSVQFSSPGAAGATEWRWDFDGTPSGPVTFDLETTDPLAGPSPVWTYSTIGTKNVWLEVRNCTQSAWVRSELEEVEILEVAQLVIHQFRVNCGFIVCSFNTGQPVSFTQLVEGDPDTYEYDWQGDGTFEQSSPTPITTHTYSSTGLFRPKLRIRRGADVVAADSENQVQIGGGGPPPTPTVSITGPTARDVGEEGNYAASAFNCTPNANGWTWNTAGGIGSSTTNQITLSWTSTGNKVITATNSGCGTASDSHTVNVTTDTGGNPNNLAAEFTVVPGSPEAGEEVEFDASNSAGDPTGWVWDFGDGEGASGEVVTHTFDQAGTYTVGLTISKTAPGCGSFGQNVCTDTATAEVTVGNGGGGGGDCVADDDTLCLMDGRFQVRVRFLHPQDGIQDAQVYEEFAADRTGMFWFFRPDNVELITKSLDGTNGDIFPDPAYWFFYGGLSNVEYWITVTDTGVSPPKTVEYHNLPGVICGLADTAAFPTEDLPEPIQGGAAGPGITDGGIFENSGPGVIAAGGASGTCVPAPGRLCLLEGRYAVEVDWHDQRSGDTGFGQAIPGTDRTGYFWFFRDDNIELVTKMLDPGPPFAHVWVLWGALSDVEYTIKVTDTVTEASKEYHNAPGSFCGGADTTAFDAD